jgi:hypothetical protein
VVELKMGVTDLLLRAGKPIFTLPGKKKSLFFSQLAEKKQFNHLF